MIFDAQPHVAHDPRRWQRLLFAPYPYTQPGS
jgi:para-nitrobenzyl esterase